MTTKKKERNFVLYTRVQKRNRNWFFAKAKRAGKSVSQLMDEVLDQLREKDAGHRK